jgi:hypothetical protein
MIINLETHWTPGDQWPPCCCVPAFVHAALVEQGVEFAAPAALPALLGVQVGKDDFNPLLLPIAPAGHARGITVEAAQISINKLFRELELRIRFRHISFREIMFGLHEDVLHSALGRDLVVGLGLDYSQLDTSRAVDDALHVVRVTGFDGRKVRLSDDSREVLPSHFVEDWNKARRAVLAVPDGFWLIGKSEDLSLPHTLPWRGGLN